MPVIYAAKAKQFELPGAHFTALASPQTGSVSTAAWRVSLTPKSDGLTHQLTKEEIIIATAGSAIAEIGMDRHEISAGDAIIIPANTDFKLSNPSAQSFTAIAMFPIGTQAKIGNEPPFTPPWTV